MVFMPARKLSMQTTLVDVQPSANTTPTPESAPEVSSLRRPLRMPAVRHALQQQCQAGARGIVFAFGFRASLISIMHNNCRLRWLVLGCSLACHGMSIKYNVDNLLWLVLMQPGLQLAATRLPTTCKSSAHQVAAVAPAADCSQY